MTRRSLKTTTASLLVISLIQPFPVMAQVRALNPSSAQQSDAKSGEARIILAQAEQQSCFTNGEVDTARCDVDMLRAELERLLADGSMGEIDTAGEDEATAALTVEERIGLLSAAIEDAELEASVAPADDAPADAEQIAQADEELTDAEAAAAAQAEAEAAQAEMNEAEAEVEAEITTTEAEDDVDALADAAAEEPDADADALADALADAEAEEEAAQEETAAEAEVEAEVETTAETEAEADAEADVATQAETEAAQAEAEAAAEEQSEAEAAAEAGVELDPAAAEAEQDAAAEAEQAEQDRAAGEVDAEAQAEAERAAQEETEASAQKDAEIIAEQEEAQNLTAVTAMGAEETAESATAGEVITEIVTEAEARSSDEEFTTRATDTPEARADSGSSGLSTLEKGGLLALGALAVGAIINNQRVTATSGDRVIVEDNTGRFQVLKDDDAVLRRPGSTVETRRFDDGSTTSTITREDGSRVVTIRDASGRVLRRSVFDLDGRETLLIDDITRVEPVNVSTLPPVISSRQQPARGTDQASLRQALRDAEARDLGRTFSLRQVRDIVEVRELAPEIALEDVTFRTGSAAIQPSEAEQLREIGVMMREMIQENPREVFLVEGYTDAVGSASFNLLLSDRRAESVALALTEYFDVPPENMIVQGYGERFLRVPTLEAERLNRRVSVRRITNLIAQR
ncbi:MAG: OmpA family protein [Rhodobacterales bacterium]